MIFNKKLYEDENYQWHKKYAEAYEIETGRRLFEYYNPKTVVDFGCGIGTYLQVAKEMGAVVRGYEIGGDFAKKYMDASIVDSVNTEADITQPISCGEFDIVICVEVAEHVEPELSQVLVENLKNACGGLCIFSAAPVGQDGNGHINCRPKEDWICMFNKAGMIPSDQYSKVKELLEGSPDYVMSNLMVFEK